MKLGSTLEGPTEIDLLVDGYLTEANGDALSALRRAVTDALREAVDARLRILELERSAAHAYPRPRLERRRAQAEAARAPG